ncbi:MAG TPA: thioredoxin domain-containing protein [Solirubrobacteraceae bacterium]|nr:thioredoxin domain-containing protein [Solirubrobacteraceae bacterium]
MPEVDEEDLTRKQRREQAREQRKAAEAAATADAARRRRLTQLAGVVAVVVVAIVVILIASGGGSSSSGKPKPSEIPTIAKEVNAKLEGIPQSGRTIGSPTAPVTMQYFGDLECPICKKFSDKEGALPALLAGPVKEGKLRIEYMNLQTATRNPETFKTQQKAALAAGAQKKGWNYIELFYNEQGQETTEYVNEAYLQGLAKQIPGLNLSQWQSERGNPKFESELQSDAQLSNNNGLTGTPSFLIGHSGGALKTYEWSSLTDPKPFEEAIEKAAKA